MSATPRMTLLLLSTTLLCFIPIGEAHKPTHHNSQHFVSGFAQSQHENVEFAADSWLKTYGAQEDLAYTGPLAFSHLPYHKCLEDPSVSFDVAFLGMPFDTATTYRSGARFGPAAIRHGSRRQREGRGYTISWGRNPYDGTVKIIDCGDVI